MPNYGYHFARAEGRAVRALYRAFLGRFSEIESTRSFPLEVFSYSGEAALPEQVASIRSFLRHVGQPPRFTVVSDGTYSDESRRVLKAIHPSVSVSDVRDWMPANLPNEIYPYLKGHPTGRQLALIMSLATNGPVLYLDSDILFFAGVNDLHTYVKANGVPAFYLADCRFSGDERLLRDHSEANDPVNTG